METANDEMFEIGKTIERLMAVQAKMELAEPPHEKDGSTRFQEFDAGQEFVDDVSGLRLNKDLAIQVIKVEIEFFKARERCVQQGAAGGFNEGHIHLMDRPQQRGCGGAQLQRKASGA